MWLEVAGVPKGGFDTTREGSGMNYLRFTVGVSLIVLVAVLAGCGGGTMLPITLTEGESISCEMATKRTVTVNAPTRTTALNATETTNYKMTFAILGVDANGMASVEVMFDEASSSTTGGESMGARWECRARSVKGMTGKKLKFQLTSDGDISSMQGVDELQSAVATNFIEALKDELGDTPEMTTLTGSARAQIADSLTVESMELMMKDVLLLRPPKPVKVGGTWENIITASKALPYDAIETFTLNKLGAGEAEIGSETVISPAAGATMPDGAPLILSGICTSIFIVDEKTGWLRESHGNTNITTQIVAAGKEAEMKTTFSTTVTRL
jgi:hypothetical protein